MALVYPVESLKDPGLMFPRDANATILDRYAVFADSNNHFPSIFIVADCVVAQIVDQLISQLQDGREFDITEASSAFSPKQAGYAVRLMNDRAAAAGHMKVLQDSLKVLAEEKEKIAAEGTDDMSDDEWADMIQNIANKKREG